MALVSMRQLLDHAAEHGYGIPAFNVNNLEQVQAIMEAAAETDSPVIMQASAGARKYAGEGFLKHLIQAAVESYPHIPVVMHQDHGQSPKVCQGAIDLGFSSVMMDGSLKEDGKTIADYDYNVEVTKKVVDVAHKLGVTVEGELGCLGSLETMQGDKEDGHGADGKLTMDQLLTDPEQAADFVRRTQLDALAIAIGTSHGAYKFTRKPTGDILSIARIKEIHARLPNTHLVMHGSSSVPQDQYRHRYPPGHDRRHPPLLRREPREVRPARIPEAGPRRRQGDLCGSLHRVRHRRQRQQDQGAAADRDRRPVRLGQADPGGAVSHRPPSPEGGQQKGGP